MQLNFHQTTTNMIGELKLLLKELPLNYRLQFRLNC